MWIKWTTQPRRRKAGINNLPQHQIKPHMHISAVEVHCINRDMVHMYVHDMGGL